MAPPPPAARHRVIYKQTLFLSGAAPFRILNTSHICLVSASSGIHKILGGLFYFLLFKVRNSPKCEPKKFPHSSPRVGRESINSFFPIHTPVSVRRNPSGRPTRFRLTPQPQPAAYSAKHLHYGTAEQRRLSELSVSQPIQFFFKFGELLCQALIPNGFPRKTPDIIENAFRRRSHGHSKCLAGRCLSSVFEPHPSDEFNLALFGVP